jgi:hypothetical protein
MVEARFTAPVPARMSIGLANGRAGQGTIQCYVFVQSVLV